MNASKIVTHLKKKNQKRLNVDQDVVDDARVTLLTAELEPPPLAPVLI